MSKLTLSLMFSTIFGTFQSHVIQMGDCNVPSTFQQLMTVTSSEKLYMYILMIYLSSQIYSRNIWEHILTVLQQLREAHFLLSKSKVDLFSNNVDCLDHVIDDKGIHTESNKMQCIWEWRTL